LKAFFTAILLACALGALPATAQEPVGAAAETALVPMPPPTDSTPRPGQGEQDAFYNPLVEKDTAAPSPFTWWPLVFRPHVSYDIMYADGILAKPGRRTHTFIQAFSPGLYVSWRRRWTLDYTPTWNSFTNPLFHNNISHYAKLRGATTYEDWAFSATQEYTHTSAVLVETGQQTTIQDYTTVLKASYEVNSQERLETGFKQDIQASDLSDIREWSLPSSLHYAVGPGWDVFASTEPGYVDVVPGFSMIFLRLQTGISWKALDALTFSAQGGVESRKIQGAGNSALNTGIFSGSIEYEPLRGTQLTASVSREVAAAYSSDISRDTQGFLRLRQQLLRFFHLTGGIGSQEVAYVPLGPGAIPIRVDHLNSWQAGFGATLFRRGSIEFDYSRALNDSNVPIFGFSSKQYEAIVSYRF
jgi:hypothetical protein